MQHYDTILTALLTAHSQFMNANSTDLWVLMNQEARRAQTISCRMNVGRVMKTWTTQPGYPLVTVNRLQNNLIHLSQVNLIILQCTFIFH